MRKSAISPCGGKTLFGRLGNCSGEGESHRWAKMMRPEVRIRHGGTEGER